MNRIILDTETAGNVMDKSSLRVYDFGFQVVDNNFNVIAAHRYFVEEIFGDADLMNSAYYARKLPQYYEAVEKGEVKVLSWLTIMHKFAAICKAYNVKEVWAFNAGFDRDATNRTTEVLSNGFRKIFVPYGVEWKCIQRAAVMTICNSRNYFKFAVENNLISKSGNVRTTAQAIYAYITKDPSFKEAHTALEDVKIETIILQKVKKQHKKIETKPSRYSWNYCQQKFKDFVEK